MSHLDLSAARCCVYLRRVRKAVHDETLTAQPQAGESVNVPKDTQSPEACATTSGTKTPRPRILTKRVGRRNTSVRAINTKSSRRNERTVVLKKLRGYRKRSYPSIAVRIYFLRKNNKLMKKTIQELKRTLEELTKQLLQFPRKAYVRFHA
ncbi:hypothetical protein BsWGS_03068 [Bradybaena similaris]